MSMDYEKMRSPLATRDFLTAIRMSDSMPDAVKQDAAFCLRHLPDAKWLERVARACDVLAKALASSKPDRIRIAAEDLQQMVGLTLLSDSKPDAVIADYIKKACQ